MARRRKKAREIDLQEELAAERAHAARYHKHLAQSATLVIGGLALVGIHDPAHPGLPLWSCAALLVGGLLAFMWTIHRYGRLGLEGA